VIRPRLHRQLQPRPATVAEVDDVPDSLASAGIFATSRSPG